MRQSLANRLDKLEAAGRPVVRVPSVLHVGRDETSAEARARFAAAFPDVPRGHRLLIVPCRDQTAEDDADFEARFQAQQDASIANAKSESRKVANK